MKTVAPAPAALTYETPETKDQTRPADCMSVLRLAPCAKIPGRGALETVSRPHRLDSHMGRQGQDSVIVRMQISVLIGVDYFKASW